MDTQKEIWLNIKENDTEALKELYQSFYNDLFNYGRKISTDKQLVEDAIQETFISIWKYRNTINIPSSTKQYLLKSFRNHLFNILKARSKTAYTDETFNFSFEVGFDEKIIEGEDAALLSERINAAVKELTNRQREIIYYRFYENLSYEEISEIMKMQTRATYKLTARALSTLKGKMDRNTFAIFLAMV